MAYWTMCQIWIRVIKNLERRVKTRKQDEFRETQVQQDIGIYQFNFYIQLYYIIVFITTCCMNNSTDLFYNR
jgi:hypothetical protein